MNENQQALRQVIEYAKRELNKKKRLTGEKYSLLIAIEVLERMILAI